LESLRRLSRSTDAVDRAVAVGALVLLGEASPELGWSDGDARVRRATAMACEPTDATLGSLLVAQMERESDPTTRLLLARGLLAEPFAAGVTTTLLRERLHGGDADAPLAAFAFARGGVEPERETIEEALRATDPVVRAHTARGLGSSREAWAIGQLADAYEAEVDPSVRREVVLALAGQTAFADLPARARALDRAERLDPEPAIRTIADRARSGLPPPRPAASSDAVWLRVMDVTGRAPSSLSYGIVVRSDGLAVPVAFDDDGYAIVPAPRGPSRLVLAPRPHAYKAAVHGD
jgi:hypothetical protein